MNKSALIILILSTSLISCKNNKEFTIIGEVKSSAIIEKLYLYKNEDLQEFALDHLPIAIDSTSLDKNGKFEFKHSSPERNIYYITNLKYSSDNNRNNATELNVPVIAENGDNLKLKITTKKGPYDSSLEEISGSSESKKLMGFIKKVGPYMKKTKDLFSPYSKYFTEDTKMPPQDSLAFIKVMEEVTQLRASFEKEALAFAQDNKDYLTAFYAASMVEPDKYTMELAQFAEDIKHRFPNNKEVQKFAEKMSKAMDFLSKPAPNFELTTPEGKLVKLSDFKGQYVLVDFWASWCGPCRQENPNVVKAFQAYKDKNFTVLGVSLDENKNKWLQAIKKDNLTWTHVSDLKGWESKLVPQYGIQGIPASFLLDPEGKIIAKNLRGQDLEDFLKKTLK